MTKTKSKATSRRHYSVGRIHTCELASQQPFPSRIIKIWWSMLHNRISVTIRL